MIGGIVGLRSLLRSITPFTVWQSAGFVRRLPTYWLLDRSDSLMVRKRDPRLTLYVTHDVSVIAPETLTAYLSWRHHFVEASGSSREALDFLSLSEGRSRLIDIGAHSGFMSSLFARSRPGPATVLSVEPDPQMWDALERARQLNSRPGTDWTIMHCAIGDADGPMQMRMSNSLYEATEPTSKDCMDVDGLTLSRLVGGLQWTPDMIKIDVESFEYEILTTSLDLLAQLRPALQLEVHWQMLHERGKSATDFLAPLADMGYRGIRRLHRTVDAWQACSRREPVTRLALTA